MSKSLMMYYTVHNSSDPRLMIEVENGTARKVSGPPADVIKQLSVDDLGVVVAFCRAVTNAVDHPTAPSTFASLVPTTR